ncbi:MAG TPA: homoserine kinase, partial [Gammaproteobacteria bacterium]|nr:homoserine kinase [Gammaproteobacteria bacterium]
KQSMKTVTAFAPATCANVAVGFDILGFPVENIGDEVTLIKREDKQIVIEAIDATETLPKEVEKNTASAVVKKLIEERQLNMGFSLRIKKGIPLGSGMGGSAASAVAALVALNAFLSEPLSKEELISYALYGEQVATGQQHPDNVVPCLYGGLTLTRSMSPIDVIQLPIPPVYCVLVHPSYRIDTKDARAALAPNLPLTEFVRQSANLAAFVAALYQHDLPMLQKSLTDVLIEPRRAKLLPGFYAVKRAALTAGAMACSFSGSGPTLFALIDALDKAETVIKQMREAFRQHGLETISFCSAISNQGARRL